jgi:hypothetical protein
LEESDNESEEKQCPEPAQTASPDESCDNRQSDALVQQELEDQTSVQQPECETDGLSNSFELNDTCKTANV